MPRIFAISPGGGIAVGTAGTPTSGGSVTAYQIDTDGNISSFGSITMYNVDGVNAIPSSVLCGLEVSPGGHWYVSRYSGRPILVTPLLGQGINPPGW